MMHLSPDLSVNLVLSIQNLGARYTFDDLIDPYSIVQTDWPKHVYLSVDYHIRGELCSICKRTHMNVMNANVIYEVFS